MVEVTESRSNDLPGLRKIFGNSQMFRWIADIVQIRLILDASAVIEDVRWLASVAKNPGARTNLLEAIQAETIMAYAPTFIEEELEKNISIISDEEDISIEKLNEQWERYRPNIELVDCGGPDHEFLDPKDAPYVKLQRKLDAPVSTRDLHFSRMGVPVIDIKVIAAARDYSREAALEYTIKIAGIGSLFVSAGMLRAVWEFGRSLGIYAQRIPAWVWMTGIAVVCAALSSERVQSWLVDKGRTWGPNARHALVNLVEEIGPIFQQHIESQRRANELRRILLSGVNV